MKMNFTLEMTKKNDLLLNGFIIYYYYSIGWPRSTLGNWQKGRLTDLMLITQLLHIEFHRQFLITILVFEWTVFCYKYLIFYQKRNRKEKNRFLLIKNKKKNVKKVYVNIEHSVHWVSAFPLKITTPLFLANTLLKSTNCSNPPFFRGPCHLVFCEHPLKVEFFSKSSKY